MMTGRDHQNETAASRQGAAAHTPSTARLALLLFPLLLLLTAGLFVFTADAASATGTVVFGPKTFSPGVYFRFFRVAEPTGPYTLRVVNGDPATGQKRVTSALVTLNNAIVVRARDFTASTSSVEKPVTLRKLNLLTVTVVGKTGSYITLSIQSQGNTPPSANAGPDQTVPYPYLDKTVTLDGSGSSDVDGDPLSFLWSFTAPAGSAAALSDPTEVKPTFVIDAAGNYVARLIVNDGLADSAPDAVTVSTQNSAPVAVAGPDQTVTTGTTVTLDGSGSSDVDGDALTYAWSFAARPDGSAATLSDPKAVSPTFAADKPGDYVVQLVVNDGKVNSVADAVAISTQNSAPVAHAGPDQSVATGTAVTLDGSGSTDVDGDALTYAWSFASRPAGSVADLSDPTAVKPTFTADKVGDYVVQLIVNDGELPSKPDTVTISTVNSKPVAQAGPDQTVFVGDPVNLDGSASSDVDGDALTFAWSLASRPAGSAAALSDSAAVKPTFTVDKAGVYVVQLIVNDGQESSAADTVTITTQNSAPVANAGPDQSVATGTAVTLDGSQSSDVDQGNRAMR